jgi:DNA-directed RNA polymerase subunit omega
MLHPSYSELMDIFNEDGAAGDKVTSRYTIVIAAARRARQLIDGAAPAAGFEPSDKAVSLAVMEMQNRKIKIKHVNAVEEHSRDDREFADDPSV